MLVSSIRVQRKKCSDSKIIYQTAKMNSAFNIYFLLYILFIYHIPFFFIYVFMAKLFINIAGRLPENSRYSFVDLCLKKTV